MPYASNKYYKNMKDSTVITQNYLNHFLFFLLHSEEELVLFGGRTNAILTENIPFPVFLLVDGVMAGLLTIDL